MEPTDVALTALRLWLGAVMTLHGVNHARNLGSTASWFESKGFASPRANAAASAIGEIAIGAALILGLLTSVAAAGLIATMTVAFVAIHRKAGFFVFNRPDEGYEYVATLSASSLALAGLGPGEVSLDAAIGVDLAGWTGIGIGVAGVLVGLGQLAAFWRPIEQRSTP
ncbi:MAG: DoxX family protein [Acidimicrobiia bacterium]|nr:DoxX family protein [Acidimicrobiia bacterium]MDH4308780.1 DoxX family protein [Acidimicrobiia bacterium]MDH5294895.1 DoxX family protein [Acidimicrobiia bacterium]